MSLLTSGSFPSTKDSESVIVKSISSISLSESTTRESVILKSTKGSVLC